MNWREKVRILLNTQDRSLRWLSRRSGVPYTTIQRWMAKKPSGRPDVDQAVKLARAFNVSLSELFDADVPLPTELRVPLAPPVVAAGEQAARRALAQARDESRRHKQSHGRGTAG